MPISAMDASRLRVGCHHSGDGQGKGVIVKIDLRKGQPTGAKLQGHSGCSPVVA